MTVTLEKDLRLKCHHVFNHPSKGLANKKVHTHTNNFLQRLKKVWTALARGKSS